MSNEREPGKESGAEKSSFVRIEVIPLEERAEILKNTWDEYTNQISTFVKAYLHMVGRGIEPNIELEDMFFKSLRKGEWVMRIFRQTAEALKRCPERGFPVNRDCSDIPVISLKDMPPILKEVEDQGNGFHP